MAAVRALIVDDDEPIRTLLATLVEHQGYAVATASDGQEAIEQIEADGFSLVLLDLMMPRVTGWEVCERLAAEPELAARHAVVVMSAGIAPGERFPDVVRAALLKPFSLTAAMALVEALSVRPETTTPDIATSFAASR